MPLRFRCISPVCAGRASQGDEVVRPGEGSQDFEITAFGIKSQSVAFRRSRAGGRCGRRPDLIWARAERLYSILTK
jgi:hypothetical protein